VLQELIRRQLPQIAQRLTTTLEKLQAPRQTTAVQVGAAAWWDALKQRYPRGEIDYSVAELAGLTVPGELFDSVAENLLQNAIAKAQQQPDLRISVSFESVAGGKLTICDTGKAMPRAIAVRLFAAPVPSQNGLGIGLYQAATQAEQLGYKLALVNNSDGQVCFELARAAS
jgi:K+-sensing histidine kinase KdpD